jgi:hypothetical protein
VPHAVWGGVCSACMSSSSVTPHLSPALAAQERPHSTGPSHPWIYSIGESSTVVGEAPPNVWLGEMVACAKRGAAAYVC